MKYTVIKSKLQYERYCMKLEELLENNTAGKDIKDEIELITLLIEKWDEMNSSFRDADPIQLLLSLMKDHSMKAKDLSELLGISKGLVSEILHYKKGLSKNVIRILSENFKVSQEAFNRKYELKSGKLEKQKTRIKKTKNKILV